jgi:hypothetical protein
MIWIIVFWSISWTIQYTNADNTRSKENMISMPLDYVKYYRVQIVHVKQKHISQDIKKKEVESFIGFNNSHLYHIKTFSELAEPLHRLTGTRDKFEWSQKCQTIFFSNVGRKSVFDIYFTEFGTALTTILPIVYQY